MQDQNTQQDGRARPTPAVTSGAGYFGAEDASPDEGGGAALPCRAGGRGAETAIQRARRRLRRRFAENPNE